MSKRIITLLAVLLITVLLGLKYTRWNEIFKPLNESPGISQPVQNLLNKYNKKKFPDVKRTASDNFNIIVILTDDQNYRTLDYMPQFKKRVDDYGVLFRNAFAANPTCCPFRASFLSGGFDSHETGVKSLDLPNGTLHRLDENRTLATFLQASGYKTGFIGKYMHGYLPGYVPPGWNSFVANEDGGMLRDYFNLSNITYGSSGPSATIGDIRYSRAPLGQYITTFQTDAAIEFISAASKSRFFLFLSYYAPHSPHDAEMPEDSEYAMKFSLICPGRYDLSSRPDWVKTVEELVASDRERYSQCGERTFRGQIALLQSVDRGIERIFESLNELEISGDTVVLFTSDNGIM